MTKFTATRGGQTKPVSSSDPGHCMEGRSQGLAKRLYDLLLSGLGLLILSPLFLLLIVLVKISDFGPVFYRQQRVGLGGRIFWILKFRSMVVNADRMGISVTRKGDPRITRVGRVLRETKLDELPQLWNVFIGDMSLVGPRPEVPRYVARYTETQRSILRLKPGITDLATLRFRNEEELLKTASDTEAFYLQFCVPRKIELNLEYARRAGLWSDTMIIFRTLLPWLDWLYKSDGRPDYDSETNDMSQRGTGDCKASIATECNSTTKEAPKSP